MRITFDETLLRTEWIHTEILNSIPHDILEKAAADRFYDIKILINGVEVEPVIFNNIMNDVEKYIDAQARSLITEKYQEAEDKARKLHEMVDAVTKSINDNFSTELEYYS